MISLSTTLLQCCIIADYDMPDDYVPVNITLAMAFKDTVGACTTISAPDNTRYGEKASTKVEYFFQVDYRSKYSHFIPKISFTLCTFLDVFLSCTHPNDPSGFGYVISEFTTRTLPPNIRGVKVSFHFICGKFTLYMIYLDTR